jgi:hypothetical protein
VGYFLAQHRAELMVDENQLAELRYHRPAQPQYFDGTREAGPLVREWNLVVPDRVARRRWEELV